MNFEEYRKALKLGQKDIRTAAARGKEDRIAVLPPEVEAQAVRRESMGIMEIPVDLLVGTCNELRRDAFSPGFYPTLPEDTEFSIKWENLCKAHLDEGIRDPIKAVEYLNRFYVIEGHKRVSVLKYFGAAAVPGMVTRLYPKPSDNPEVISYYEFLDFYQMTGISYMVFRKPGEYKELIEALGIRSREPWSAEQIYQFRSFYYMLRGACVRQGIEPEYVPLAFLTYVKIFGYEASLSKNTFEIMKELPRIRPEIMNRLENAGTTLMLDDDVKKPLIPSILPSGGKLTVAFLHGSSASKSKWVYAHEYGRYNLENAMNEQVQTIAFEDITTEEAAAEALEAASREGADMIFTTSPTLLMPSVKHAVLHPETKILNCSLNTSYPSVRTYYPRLYGATFIQGALAATLSPDGRIGYVEDYPTFGSVANVNAFAQGARLINANARVYLEWGHLTEYSGFERLQKMGITHICHLGRLAATPGTAIGGLHNLALVQIKWGRMYRSFVRRVLEGSWKKEIRGNSAVNYWWGMNEGIVDVMCSRRLPVGTRRLIGLLRDALHSGRLDPFYGVLMDQQGHYDEDVPLPAEQILTMNKLSDFVEGRLPAYDQLDEKAKILVNLQGLDGVRREAL